MKVRITATEDTIVMKFLRPNADTKLEGYILGYGSSMFSKQFIQLPENGQPYESEFGEKICQYVRLPGSTKRWGMDWYDARLNCILTFSVKESN